jgi:hypothetical protein
MDTMMANEFVKSQDLTNLESLSYDEKHNLLQNFIKSFDYLPVQGSVEWLQGRINSVGGSELATVAGRNSYGGIPDLIAGKIGLTKFRGNLYTKWGKIMEEVLRLYMNQLYNYEILETGALPGIYPGSTYSPDGLGIVEFNDEYKYDTPEDVPEDVKNDPAYRKVGPSTYYKKVQKLTLFEFKCPFTRDPDYAVPKTYIDQISSGLSIIPVVEVGLFIDAVLRRCTWADLDFTGNYDTEVYERKNKTCKKYDSALAIGFIGIYHKPETYEVINTEDMSQEELKELFSDAVNGSMDTSNERSTLIDWAVRYCKGRPDDLSDGIADFGSGYRHVMEEVMGQATTDHSSYFAYYTDVCMAPDDLTTTPFDKFSELEKFKKYCTDNKFEFVGVLPYKLLLIDTTIIEKDPLYVYQFRPAIEEALTAIKELMAVPEADRLSAYIAKYPWMVKKLGLSETVAEDTFTEEDFDDMIKQEVK